LIFWKVLIVDMARGDSDLGDLIVHVESTADSYTVERKLLTCEGPYGDTITVGGYERFKDAEALAENRSHFGNLPHFECGGKSKRILREPLSQRGANLRHYHHSSA